MLVAPAATGALVARRPATMMAVAAAVGGENIGETVEGLARFPISVRYPRELRDSVDEIRMLPIVTDSGAQIPLSALASVRIVDGPPMLRSENAQRTVWIYIETRDRDLGGYVEEARRAIDAAVPLAIAVGVDPGAFLKEVLETYFPVPRGLTIAFDSTMQNEDAIVDLNFKVRETFHRKFKLAATARGISMKELLERVQNGAFAREWILENQAGRPRMKAWMARERQHPIEQVGAELRRMMPWMEPKGAPDA